MVYREEWMRRTHAVERIVVTVMSSSRPCSTEWIRRESSADLRTTKAVLRMLSHLWVLQEVEGEDSSRWVVSSEFRRFQRIERLRWRSSLPDLRRMQRRLRDTVCDEEPEFLRRRLEVVEDAIERREAE